MVMRPAAPAPRLRGHQRPRWLRLPWWLWRPSRRRQARVNFHFWGLVHDHDWLQYDPPKAP